MEGAIVSFVVEQLGNLIKDEVSLSIDVKKEVEKLHSKFTAIRARLGKAEMKQFTDETVRDWLRKIREVGYEVEDILDEWRTDAFLSQRDKDGIGNQRTVGFPSFFHRPFFKRLKLRHETGQRIRELTERLDGISKEKIDFSWYEDHNIEEVELMTKMKARETGSLIDESMVFGRDRVKEIIINELISDNNREQKSVSITSIVGMGGLGKTTLAQLVCNNERVKTHFNKKIIWVCVSDPFDVSKIANKVIKSLSGSNLENSDLDTLQHSLREAVSKMSFLLVLDDVWNEDKTLWKQLKVPLMGAPQGSQILVTTRSRKAAEVMETIHFHDLEHLSHSDCWSLFKSIAFKGAEGEEFQELTKVGEDIVWRCKGLPLAVRAVGSLLGCRRTYGYWKHILDSRIWEWDDDILPALLLSYYSLPFHLKRCFSFCSLFPKDYEMKKDELVKLWMAHGLIESKKADIEVDLEEIGEMYFDDLLARSLFQDAKKGDVEMERMEGVFEGLGPLHSNPKKLEIKNYVGSKFPSWLEDFQSLTEVTLENCRKLRQLPSLGNLCSLKSLKIVGADEVKVVGVEFYRNGAGRGRVFPKLERLHFEAMANWEQWKLTDEYEDQYSELPMVKQEQKKWIYM
ncbi:hypothetical protein AAC387_Pa02g2794 [Persea americana]